MWLSYSCLMGECMLWLSYGSAGMSVGAGVFVSRWSVVSVGIIYYTYITVYSHTSYMYNYVSLFVLLC